MQFEAGRYWETVVEESADCVVDGLACFFSQCRLIEAEDIEIISACDPRQLQFEIGSPEVDKSIADVSFYGLSSCERV